MTQSVRSEDVTRNRIGLRLCHAFEWRFAFILRRWAFIWSQKCNVNWIYIITRMAYLSTYREFILYIEISGCLCVEGNGKWGQRKGCGSHADPGVIVMMTAVARSNASHSDCIASMIGIPFYLQVLSLSLHCRSGIVICTAVPLVILVNVTALSQCDC